MEHKNERCDANHYANQKTDVDELIKTHSNLVRKVPGRCMVAPSMPEIEDVMQIGFGLVNAASNIPAKKAPHALCSIKSRARSLTICARVQICATTIQIKRNIIRSCRTCDKIYASAHPCRNAADMGMASMNSEWEQAFRANAHESLADVYDQYSIYVRLKKTTQKKNWVMRS